MREQFEHLTALSQLSNIDIRILPLNGEHLVGTGAFNYLRFSPIHHVSLNDYVVFEHLAGMDEAEDENEVNQYKVVFESLMNDALRADEARAAINAAVNRLWTLVPGLAT
jgi:hypothetical protein